MSERTWVTDDNGNRCSVEHWGSKEAAHRSIKIFICVYSLAFQRKVPLPRREGEMSLTHGSLFAGIGGPDLGFERVGFRTVWQVEIDPFCRRVLARRFPSAERFEDVKACGAQNLKAVDCITAGVPCQDVSVAGKRAGLAGERTGLFYEFARILRELRPAWFVFENVPGLFSSNGGRDFAEVLRVLMVECGYGVSWRVFDSQFFGVAQRRRRVFIVGSFGRPCPAEILFEPASGARNLAKSRKKRTDTSRARALANSSASSGYRFDPNGEELIAACLNSGGNDGGFRTEPGEHLVCGTIGCKERGSPDSSEAASNQLIATLRVGGREQGAGSSYDNTPTVAYALRTDPGGIGQGHNTTYAVTENMRNRSQGPANYVGASPDADGVRDFTGLPKGLDSPRYRALGNAWTVQVGFWIARRIARLGHGEAPSKPL